MKKTFSVTKYIYPGPALPTKTVRTLTPKLQTLKQKVLESTRQACEIMKDGGWQKESIHQFFHEGKQYRLSLKKMGNRSLSVVK